MGKEVEGDDDELPLLLLFMPPRAIILLLSFDAGGIDEDAEGEGSLEELIVVEVDVFVELIALLVEIAVVLLLGGFEKGDDVIGDARRRFGELGEDVAAADSF